MDEPKRYESAKYLVRIIGFAIDVLLLYLISSRFSLRIRQFAEASSNSKWVSVAIYTLVLMGILKLFDLPLSFYSGYVLEHRFGLSRQSLASWIKDLLKAIAIGIGLTIGAVEILYALLRARPDTWWIYGGAGFIAFVIVMTNL